MSKLGETVILAHSYWVEPDIAGKSRQDLETASHIITTVKSREKNACFQCSDSTGPESLTYRMVLPTFRFDLPTSTRTVLHRHDHWPAWSRQSLVETLWVILLSCVKLTSLTIIQLIAVCQNKLPINSLTLISTVH